MHARATWFVTWFVLAAGSAGAQSVGFEVGVAKVNVTPSPGSRMYGYEARKETTATGVHDPLYARALVASDGRAKVALVTLDLGYVDTVITREVREAVDQAIGLRDVLLFGSHTHSGPLLSSDLLGSERMRVQDLADKIAQAVVEADASRQPARLAAGWGRVEEGYNRRRVFPDGTVTMRWENRGRRVTSPLDYAVGVLVFDSPNGDPIATLVNFTCHPMVLGPDNLEFSADYPGAMMAMVDERVGGQTMFIQGAAGDINPFWHETPIAEGAFEQMEQMGEAVAREVVRIRSDITGYEEILWISLYQELLPVATRWDVDEPEVRELLRADYLAQYERERIAEVNTLLFGPTVAIATFPGEFFVEHGLRLKQQSLVRHTFFAGYSNGNLGYFPTIRAAAEGGYGADTSTIVELGAGERLITRALINLHFQAGKLKAFP